MFMDSFFVIVLFKVVLSGCVFWEAIVFLDNLSATILNEDK